MQISNKIKNPLLSIETILENGLKVANNQEREQVIISKQDTLRMLEWLDELHTNELIKLSKVENILSGNGCYLLN